MGFIGQIKRQTQHSPFTESEYDFSDVKSGEDLTACYWYEYARESRAVMEEIAIYRKQTLKSRGKPQQLKFGPRVRNFVQSHILVALAITSGFPQIPWRNLSDKDRGNFLKMMLILPQTARHALTWNNPPLICSIREPGDMTLDMWTQKVQQGRSPIPDNEPIKRGFFAVNLKYGRRVLIEEFARYLTHFEGKAMSETPPIETEIKAPKRPPGRKSLHDILNALGVMRLRFHCETFSEAKQKMLVFKGKKHGIHYWSRQNANRACNIALTHFRQLYGWLDSQNPIHFTKGWGFRNEK